jgi:hypothetical protein
VLKVYFLVRRMRIVRMPRNALCRRALRLCAAVRIMRMAHGFASVADNAQAGNPVAEPAFAEFAGFACHSTEGGLPADIPMREARARRSDSVSGQTEVCRVCDLHPVRVCRQRVMNGTHSVRTVCRKHANPLPGRDLRGYATHDGKGWELNSHPWNRKTVTPIPASTGAAFGRFQGRKSANRPP